MILAIRRLPVLAERLRSLWPLVLWALVGLVGFTWLCDSVGDHDGATYVDQPVADWFVRSRTGFEGSVGLLIANATSPLVLIAVTVVASAVLWRMRHRRIATILLLSVTAAYGVGGIAKYMEHRARPAAPINLAPEAEGSFPSGHVLVVATIAAVSLGVSWSYLSRTMRIVASLAAALGVTAVALDRLVVGAHWLTDVVASLFLASIIAAIALTANSVWEQR